MKFKDLNDPDIAVWIKDHFNRGMTPRTISEVIQLAELTGEDLDEIVVRFNIIEMFVKDLCYGR